MAKMKDVKENGVKAGDLIARYQGMAKSYRDRAQLDRTEAARLSREADANEGAAAALDTEVKYLLESQAAETPEPKPEEKGEGAASPEPAKE